MVNFSNAVEYTSTEGGMWQPWPEGFPKEFERVELVPGYRGESLLRCWQGKEGIEFHALKLDNGKTWDVQTGFRH